MQGNQYGVPLVSVSLYAAPAYGNVCTLLGAPRALGCTCVPPHSRHALRDPRGNQYGAPLAPVALYALLSVRGVCSSPWSLRDLG